METYPAVRTECATENRPSLPSAGSERCHSLLSDPDGDRWQAGAHIAGTLPLPEAVHVLFPLLTLESGELRRRNAQLLASLLSDAIFERFTTPSPGTDLCQDAPQWLHPALNAVVQLAQRVQRAYSDRGQDPSAFARLCDALGSQPDLLATLTFAATGDQAQDLLSFLALFRPHTSPRQLVLALTYRCAADCTYCYSRGLAASYPQDMTLESLRDVVGWVKRNGIALLLLAGGEPTEYPHLNTVLHMLRSEGLSAYLATNNLSDLGQLHTLGSDVLNRVTVHLWDTDRYLPEQWQRFRHNLTVWRDKGVDVSLRYNLLDPREYPAELFELCDAFGVRHITIGLPFPTPGGTCVAQEDFRLFAPLLVDLAKEAQAREVDIRLAKPLPWCAFDHEQIQFLKRVGLFSAVCSIHHDRGARNVVVNPDLSTFACQALPRPGTNLSALPTFADLACAYELQVRAALRQPLYEKCTACYYYAQRACQGACLAYKRLLPDQPGEPQMPVAQPVPRTSGYSKL